MRAEFRVLGPLCVQAGNLAVQVTAGRQRVVLATLAIRAGRVVSFEELAEALWDETPPPNARVAVRNHVKRLRQVLGSAGGRIVTRTPGYLLEADDDDVDLLAFTRLCREGGAAARAGAWPEASVLLGDALALWRGTPLADVPSRMLRDEHGPVLESLRLQAVEWWHEAGLRLGKHGELVSELGALTREHPLRERFRAQYMLALYRCGRQSDALAAYRSARTALVEELGIEPGPDLQDLHQRILDADPDLLLEATAATGTSPPGPQTGAAASPGGLAPTVPRQLPADLRHFAGRRSELNALAGLLAEVGRPGGTVVISAIDGTAGVGKTTLAVHWAHLVASDFPDGQLYVNLRGFDSSGAPVTAPDVVRDFLAALGTPCEQVPASPQAQAALYRTIVAGKRLLIVLDNARDVDQVRPLLPGSPGCLVLVTSRAGLTGLAATDGAHLMVLDMLDEQDARALLACRLGAARMAAEQTAADEVIGLCARLPLALSIAGARAAARPRFPLAVLAGELRDAGGRLDALDTGEATSSVRAVFSWSYQELSQEAARVFRLLGLHPGPDVSAPAAASLAGLPPPRARAALHELTRASLIAEQMPGRYVMHDLLRVYASELAEATDPVPERQAARHRMLDHYLYSANAAAVPLDPVQETYTTGPPQSGVTPEPVGDRDQGLAWFATEDKVLLAVAQHAAETSFDSHAQRLAWTLLTYFDRVGNWQGMATLQRIALACSRRLGDLAGQAHAHRNLARGHLRLGQADEAQAHLAQAVRLSRRLGDPVGEAQAHLSLSVAFHSTCEPHESLRASQRALELAEAAGNPVLWAMACNNVGYNFAKLGDLRQALTYCRRALKEHRQVGRPSTLEATTWDSLGYIYHHLGDHQQATRSYLRAIDLFRQLGVRYQQAESLSHLGDVYDAAGDTLAS
ncbi:MAG TPA: BTAD domain-containing putative transcriptional regulator, partial [Streptosporangiaceae bacterium]|nr:BTAD domain-containing putative transcriptional regulator [Streptosporangiaceae bacterium]